MVGPESTRLINFKEAFVSEQANKLLPQKTVCYAR